MLTCASCVVMPTPSSSAHSTALGHCHSISANGSEMGHSAAGDRTTITSGCSVPRIFRTRVYAAPLQSAPSSAIAMSSGARARRRRHRTATTGAQ